MFYRKEIIEKLKTDTILRLKVCLALGVTEQSVHMALKRKRKMSIRTSRQWNQGICWFGRDPTLLYRTRKRTTNQINP